MFHIIQCTSSSYVHYISFQSLNVHRSATQYALSVHKFATCHLDI